MDDLLLQLAVSGSLVVLGIIGIVLVILSGLGVKTA